MKISARNILKGKIVSMVSGTVNTEVQLELPGGDIIVSVLTKEAAQKLELEVGKTAKIYKPTARPRISGANSSVIKIKPTAQQVTRKTRARN
jgi:molybdopterin-binding protein